MSNERIDIETMEARIRLWQAGDISDEDLALEMDYMVPELKRCYEEIDYLNALTNNLPVEMLVEAEKKLQASK